MGKREIIADFEIITPMFLGEADQCAVSIRPQSIKGELAFWWRALHYAEYVDKSLKDNSDPLAAMHRDEQLLFGSTGGQAAFLLSVTHGDLTKLNKSAMLPGANAGCRYLGYGVMETNGNLIRSCFKQGETFSIGILLRPQFFKDKDGHPIDRQELIAGLIKSLKIMGLLGGLGSRKRRGYGSIAMTKMTVEGLEEGEPFDAPTDCASYTNLLKNLIGTTAQGGTSFPLSAFAKETELRIWSKSEASAMAALEAIGAEFQHYRGWGHDTPPKVAGKPSRKNFEGDHDWFKSGRWATRTGDTIPERAVFGLPHNYSSRTPVMKLNVEPSGDFGRRASPLLFHIHKLGDNYRPVATYFDTQFLPDSAIKLTDVTDRDKRRHVVIAAKLSFDPKPAVVIPDVVRNFLDGGNRSTTAAGTANPALFTKVLP
jgi:CRISPR-associated protein Cmr1